MSYSAGDAPHRRAKKQPEGWQKVLFYWRLPVILVLFLMILSGLAVHMVSSSFAARRQAKADMQAKAQAQMVTYEQAVVDALTAEEGEMRPLVSLTREDGRVTYDAETDRVLLIFWTNEQGIFEKDAQTTLEHYTYAYADLELFSWGAEHKDVLKTSGEKRLTQLLGLGQDSKNTIFAVAWVTPERVNRPAYQSDAQDGSMQLGFAESTDHGFVTWFDAELERNYLTKPRPWTRLGYTYDWGKAGDDHGGVTEFVVPAGTKVMVKEVFTNEEMIARLRKGKLG